jgi:hypothetical protein
MFYKNCWAIKAGLAFIKQTSARYGRKNPPTGKRIKEDEETQFCSNALYSAHLIRNDHLLQSSLNMITVSRL